MQLNYLITDIIRSSFYPWIMSRLFLVAASNIFIPVKSSLWYRWSFCLRLAVKYCNSITSTPQMFNLDPLPSGARPPLQIPKHRWPRRLINWTSVSPVSSRPLLLYGYLRSEQVFGSQSKSKSDPFHLWSAGAPWHCWERSECRSKN